MNSHPHLKKLAVLVGAFGLANFVVCCWLYFFYKVPPGQGGIDLLMRWYDVHQFFQPGSFYGVRRFSVYPPASYVMLWPLVGWAHSFSWAKAALAVQFVFLIPALAWIGCRITRARSKQEILVVSALVFTNFGVGICVKNGQVALHLLLLLFAAWFAGQRARPRWLLAAACLTLAMIKPAFALPFFLLLLFRPIGWLTAYTSAIFYGWLTFGFKPYAGYDAWRAIHAWRGTLNYEEQFLGYGDTGSLLRMLGHTSWLPAISVISLVLFAAFLLSVRRAEPFLLFALTAAFARTWGYHRVYDDVLLIPLGLVLLRAVFATPTPFLKWITAVFALAHVNIEILILKNEDLGLPTQIFRILVTAVAVAWLFREIWRQRIPATSPVPLTVAG